MCALAPGEPELGALLICKTDVDVAAAGAGEATSTALRRHTGLAELHPRYKFAPG